MNKLSLTCAAICLCGGAAHAQTSVNLYGLIDLGLTYNSKVATSPAGATASKLSMDSGSRLGSRLGFIGSEDLGGGLKAYFQLESGFNADTGAMAFSSQTGKNDVLFGRRALVGLSGPYGSVSMGRQYDILTEIGGATSSLLSFGTIMQNIHGGLGLDRVGLTLTNNSVKYETPNLDGWVGSAIVGLGEQAGNRAAGQAIGIGGKYQRGPLFVGIGYYQSKLGATPADASFSSIGAVSGNPGDTALKTGTLGASYQAGAARWYGALSLLRQPLARAATTELLATFLPTGTQFVMGGSNNGRTAVLDAGVDYALSAALCLSASIEHAAVSFVGAGRGRMNQLNLGVDYLFSKRTDVYAMWVGSRAADLYSTGALFLPTGRANPQNAVRIGLRHTF